MPEGGARQDEADASGTQEAKDKEMMMIQEERKLVRCYFPSVMLTVMSGGMLFSARQAIALKQFDNNVSQMVEFLTTLASAGAFVEFLSNPVFGKLADAYGRRSVLPIGNIAVVIVRSLLFLKSDKRWPIVLEQAVQIPLVTSFFTTYRAAIGDKLQGAAFARANATISMGAGVALVSGPLIAKAVMNRADPKYCYLVSVGLSSLSLLNIMARAEETLPVEKRQPVVLSDMAPFAFMRLFTTRALNRLMAVVGMQSFTEGRNITDIMSIYMQHDLKWNWNQVNNYISAYGIVLILSGLTVKKSLAFFGLVNFTTFSNVCNILNLFCNAMVPPFGWLSSWASMYLGILFGAPGGRKRDAAESLIMQLGAKEGFGNGFISGAMNNFRAVINIIGPTLFGRIYARGAAKGKGSVVFLVGALTIVAAELALRTLSLEELGLDKNGQLKVEDKNEEANSKKEDVGEKHKSS